MFKLMIVLIQLVVLKASANISDIWSLPGEEHEENDRAVWILEDVIPIPQNFRKYTVSNYRVLHDWVDQTIETLLLSKVFLEHYPGDLESPDDLVSELGISRELAKRLTGKAAEPEKPITAFYKANADLSEITIDLVGYTPAKYVIYFYDSGNPLPWSSWSTEVNRTQIFLDSMHVTKLLLSQIIVHEYGLKRDAKKFSVVWWKNEFGFVPKKLKQFLTSREIYRAFRTLRAFRFEERVITELFPHSVSFYLPLKNFDGSQCKKLLTGFIQQNYVQGLATSGVSLEQTLKIVEDSPGDVCVRLAEVKLEPYNGNGGAGPRPLIIGGTN